MGRCPRQALRFDAAAIRQVARDLQRAVTHRRPDGSRARCHDGPSRSPRDEARNEEGEHHRSRRHEASAGPPPVIVIDDAKTSARMEHRSLIRPGGDVEGLKGPNSLGCSRRPYTATVSERVERKVVTILFCDLVGFTSKYDLADPEDVQQALAVYHARVLREIERFGGTAEKFIGDAVMAVYGAPVAHEDDAQRALLSALRIRRRSRS